MERAAAAILLLSRVFSLTWAFPQKSFTFIPNKMDWPSARHHCAQNFVDLASVTDEVDLMEMSALVDTADQYVFVGLKREWQWATSTWDDSREARISFNAFEDGEPNEKHECGTIGPSGRWRTWRCNTLRPFFCYDATAENVTDRFVRGNDSMNWRDSRMYCWTHHTDLARVRSQAENQLLVDLFNGTSNDTWIGLAKRFWSWSDGSHAGFVPWVPERPNPRDGEHCAALNLTGEPVGLVPWNCDDPLPFFCYRYPKQKFTLKISLSVTEGTVDSAADSVTEMVRSKLKDLGVSEDVHLSWSKRPQKVPPAP